MTDIFPEWKRREIMSRVRSKNTRPELLIRSILHGYGYRFRIHRKDLPGKPDIVFPKYRAVLFIHGCFWHGHDCPRGKLPTGNVEFWTVKIEKNRRRDIETGERLSALGWRSLVVWTCEIRNRTMIKTTIDHIMTFLSSKSESDNHS